MSTKIDSGKIITSLLVLLCALASLDLWRQYAINSSDYWYLQYALAVRSSDKFWKLGFRLEDLEIKLESQRQRWASITQSINTIAPRFSLTPKSLRPNIADDVSLTRRSRLAVHNLLNNETSVGQVRCGTDGKLLRVGLNDFRTDTRDMCGLFTSTGTDDQSGPHSMFEMVYLDEGAFSLKFLGKLILNRIVTHYFLRYHIILIQLILNSISKYLNQVDAEHLNYSHPFIFKVTDYTYRPFHRHRTVCHCHGRE